MERSFMILLFTRYFGKKNHSLGCQMPEMRVPTPVRWRTIPHSLVGAVSSGQTTRPPAHPSAFPFVSGGKEATDGPPCRRSRSCTSSTRARWSGSRARAPSRRSSRRASSPSPSSSSLATTSSPSVLPGPGTLLASFLALPLPSVMVRWWPDCLI
jgi:hypothetical protein